MPPKGSNATATKAQAGATTKAAKSTTSTTRGKRATEPSTDEPTSDAKPKPKRGAKKATQEEPIADAAEDTPAEPKKPRGRAKAASKAAEPQDESTDQPSKLKDSPPIERIYDHYLPNGFLTEITEPKRAKSATKKTESETESSMFMNLAIRNSVMRSPLTLTERTTGKEQDKGVPEKAVRKTTGQLRLPSSTFTLSLTTPSPEAPKRGRANSKAAKADKAEPVVEAPEEITVPKSRAGKTTKAKKTEVKVVDTSGTQATETKKRGRAAATQLKEELENTVIEAAKDAPKRRGKVPKAAIESEPEEKPKAKKTAATKKSKAAEPEASEEPAPKASRSRKKAAPEPEPEEKPKGTATDYSAEGTKLTDDSAMKGRAKKSEAEPKTESAKPKGIKSRSGKKKEAPVAAESSIAPVRKGRGRAKKEEPVDTEVPAEETAESAEPTADAPQESKSKRVSIAPGPHPEAATPAKKTPAPPKRASTASAATTEVSSSKSSGRGKRPASESESNEPASSPAAKRAKRTSDGPSEPTTKKQAPSDSRRKTIAGPATPDGKAPQSKAPKTAPPKAKTAVLPKTEASSAKSTPRSTQATPKEKTGEAEQKESKAEEASASAKRAKATPRTSTAGKPSATEAVTPKVTKASTKPPKTVQPQKTTKAAGIKRKRASSPGPARETKRLNQGSGVDGSFIPATPNVTAALKAVLDWRPKSGPAYWLLKAEPDSRVVNGHDVKFSIDDLAAVTEPEPWSGVRNHSAKNNMLAMRKGDLAFFYHSNCKVPGVVGICEIVGEAVPDETAFEVGHPYYDEKSNRDKPTWYNVHVAFRQKFANPDVVTNKELKSHKELENMQYITAARLSVSKVESKEWNFIMKLAGETLAEERVEKDWVFLSQDDVVEDAAHAVANVISGVAHAVAEKAGDIADALENDDDECTYPFPQPHEAS